jgi:hypothetical protein
MPEAGDHQQQPPITFAAFIMSLATSALVALGDAPDPESGKAATPDPEAASQLIEILGMLEQKTKGNLDADESRLLDDILYQLRMRFVEVRQQHDRRIIVP